MSPLLVYVVWKDGSLARFALEGERVRRSDARDDAWGPWRTLPAPCSGLRQLRSRLGQGAQIVGVTRDGVLVV